MRWYFFSVIVDRGYTIINILKLLKKKLSVACSGEIKKVCSYSSPCPPPFTALLALATPDYNPETKQNDDCDDADNDTDCSCHALLLRLK